MKEELLKQAELENMNEVKRIVEEGALIDQQDHQGRTPLMIAVQKNNLEMASYLMEKGADLNVRDNTMLSPWLCAGANGFHRILEKALEFSPDKKSTNRFGGTVLLPSSEKGYLKTVEVGIKAGVPVNHVNDLGWSALQEAVILGNESFLYCDIIRRLMENGADPEARDHDGNSSIDIAKKRDAQKVLSILKKREEGKEDEILSIRNLIEREHYLESLQEIEKLLSNDENHLEAYYLKGYVHTLLLDYENALASYQKATEKEGALPEFYFYTANILRLMKKSEEALSEYEKAIAMDEKNFFYRYHMSNYLRELGKHEKAIKAMDALLDEDPSRYDYYFHKANSLRSLGNHDEAILAMDQAILSDPVNSLYIFHKAQSLHLMNRLEQAKELLLEALSMKKSAVYEAELDKVEKALKQM